MLKACKAEGKQLLFEIKTLGLQHNFMYVAKRCRTLVSENINKTSPVPSFASISVGDLAPFTVEDMSQTTGIDLRCGNADLTLPAVGAVGRCSANAHRRLKRSNMIREMASIRSVVVRVVGRSYLVATSWS